MVMEMNCFKRKMYDYSLGDTREIGVITKYEVKNEQKSKVLLQKDERVDYRIKDTGGKQERYYVWLWCNNISTKVLSILRKENPNRLG